MAGAVAEGASARRAGRAGPARHIRRGSPVPRTSSQGTPQPRLRRRVGAVRGGDLRSTGRHPAGTGIGRGAGPFDDARASGGRPGRRVPATHRRLAHRASSSAELLASIAWSVDLLDETDQAVLRRLAVFHAPFTLDGAEAVTADDRFVAAVEVLDTLSRLVDKSLVEFDDSADRYRLLTTVRQFGVDRCASGASWPSPARGTPAGSPTCAPTSAAVSTAWTTPSWRRICPTSSPSTSGPTTPTRRAPTG